MLDYGYKRTFVGHCVYIQNFANNDFIVLSLYVDDMPMVGKDKSKIDRLKKKLSKSFDVNDLELAQHILRIKNSHYMKAEKKLWLS